MPYPFPDAAASSRLRPDDDIYESDRSYLGPAPYTLPFRIPYRSIPVALAVFVAALPLCRLAGVHGLAVYALSAAAGCGLAAAAVRFTSAERPVSALIAIAWHEVSAPRPPRRPPRPETRVTRPGLVPVLPPRRPRGNRRRA